MEVVDFDSLEGDLNNKFKDKGLLVHVITYASLQSSGVSSYGLAQNFSETVKSRWRGKGFYKGVRIWNFDLEYQVLLKIKMEDDIQNIFIFIF